MGDIAQILDADITSSGAILLNCVNSRGKHHIFLGFFDTKLLKQVQDTFIGDPFFLTEVVNEQSIFSVKGITGLDSERINKIKLNPWVPKAKPSPQIALIYSSSMQYKIVSVSMNPGQPPALGNVPPVGKSLTDLIWLNSWALLLLSESGELFLYLLDTQTLSPVNNYSLGRIIAISQAGQNTAVCSSSTGLWLLRLENLDWKFECLTQGPITMAAASGGTAAFKRGSELFVLKNTAPSEKKPPFIFAKTVENARNFVISEDGSYFAFITKNESKHSVSILSLAVQQSQPYTILFSATNIVSIGFINNQPLPGLLVVADNNIYYVNLESATSPINATYSPFSTSTSTSTLTSTSRPTSTPTPTHPSPDENTCCTLM